MPLNPTLHSALARCFKRVGIVDAGQPMVCQYRRDWNGRVRLIPSAAGEYYKVDCPFCGDSRGRLWINHRWGVFDPQTRTRNRWLAHCYNENCLADESNRNQLFGLIAGEKYLGVIHSASIPIELTAEPPKAVPLPNDFVRLDRLGVGHPAVKYVKKRRFDPKQLAADWQVGYSPQGCRWWREGRLVIPIYRGYGDSAELCGWQARAIEAGDEPKYYTAQGMKKSQVLYGLQRCGGTGPVIICEGPTDVWRIGANAVALLGKTISAEQVSLIHRHFVGRSLVVMLDGDAKDDALKIQQRLVERRRNSLLHPDKAPVVLAHLPDETDPASCSRERIEAAVKGAISAVGRGK